jgi:hypothetical protein
LAVEYLRPNDVAGLGMGIARMTMTGGAAGVETIENNAFENYQGNANAL